jgi:hypothetical protein
MASESPTVPDTAPTEDELDERILAEHRSLPADLRQTVLTRDDNRCQIDGYRQPDGDSTTQLVVQRITDHPADCDADDPENLVVRCLRCARWVAQMPDRDDLPQALQRRLNGVELKSTRVQILRYLHDAGPASTSDIAAHVSGLSTTHSVRCALYDLMRVDLKHDHVEDPLIRKDSVSGEYGLPWHISDGHDERGRIPLDPKTRQIRILDAVVARMIGALDGEVEEPKELAATVVAREPGSLDDMQRRAEALRFPFADWADAHRSPYSDLAVVEAVDVLAKATDNVSPRRAAEVVVELLGRNSEQDLADLLRDYYIDETEQLPLSDRRDHPTTDNDSDDSPAADHDEPNETTEHTDLQVISEIGDGRADGVGNTTVESVTEGTDGK